MHGEDVLLLIGAALTTTLTAAVATTPASSAAAAAPASKFASSPLGLADALDLVGRNASLRLLRAEADLSRAQIDSARAPASPVLALGTTRFSAREIVSVSQDIRWAGERKHSVLSAERLAGAADAIAARGMRDTRRLVRQAWFALAGAEDAEALGSDASRRAEEVVRIVRARFEGGRAPRLDLVRAEAEASRLSATRRALAEDRRVAWAHLATLIGLDPTLDDKTDQSRPAPVTEEAVEALVAKASVDEQPAVRAAAQSLAAAAEAREVSRRRLFPGLSLALGVNADDPGLPGPDRQATLSLTLPMGARGRSAVRVAQAQVNVQEAGLEVAKREAREALEVAHRRLLGLRAQLDSYDREAVPAASEAARLTREAYEAGRGDILRVVDAERALNDVRLARLSAYTETKAAEADLIAAAGKEGE